MRDLGAVGGGRKSPFPIDKAHGLYNCLYYCTSRDRKSRLLNTTVTVVFKPKIKLTLLSIPSFKTNLVRKLQ